MNYTPPIILLSLTVLALTIVAFLLLIKILQFKTQSPLPTLQTRQSLSVVDIERSRRVFETIKKSSIPMSFESICRAMPDYTKEAISNGLAILVENADVIEDMDLHTDKWLYSIPVRLDLSNHTGIHPNMLLTAREHYEQLQQRRERK